MKGDPAAEIEGGLPANQGEFAISVPWRVRLLLTAAIGAAIGTAAATMFSPRAGAATMWSMVLAGAIAASLLSIRRVHGWHFSTFADGTLAGLAAGPAYVLLLLVRAALLPESQMSFAAVGQNALSLLLHFVGVLIVVPCGWLAGFVYHVAISAVERGRAGKDRSA